MSCTGCSGGCNDCGGLECGTGAAGLNGLNAFTTTTATFSQPDFGDPAIDISVSALGQLTGTWAQVGQRIFIEGAGYFEVTASTSTTISVIVPSLAIETVNHAIAASGATIAIGSGVSPAGVEGSGSNGSNGTDGVSILFQNISVSSPTTIGSSFTDVIFSNAPITIPANTLADVGDMLRIEIMFQNDTTLDVATMPVATSFNGQISFGGSQVWEGIIGQGDFSELANAYQLVLDLIVTATNTLSMRVFNGRQMYGGRSSQAAFISPYSPFAEVSSIPPRDSAGSSIGAITPTLTNSNAITVQIKNSTGTSTHIASVTSIMVTKFLKS